MKKELTKGNVQRTLLLFAGPMILGNLLQQWNTKKIPQKITHTYARITS